ncbi:aminoglycoside phosphotransferase family protein [Aureimonas ureilytica]|uniref:aminoglycoside phosphotransferase family protein n=1 Tax=Aureimonas ureilytica TaxID=401562 RepID=UPI000733EF83|nr:aminoglycoside phosphotransferase family protein [Aureimonas ureilytica]
MHDDDLSFPNALIEAVLRDTGAGWAGLPIRPVPSTGTDNHLFRIGDCHVLRLPRRASAVPLLVKELDWLPRLQGLPLAVPRLRLRTEIDVGWPCPFGLWDWIEGNIASSSALADPVAAARALAEFLRVLQSLPSQRAPMAGESNHQRGVALTDISERTQAAIGAVADEVDVRRAHSLWERALCERYASPGVWLHGDLKADNLIAREGVLVGVIDWGLSAVGDPAVDYAAAWSWVDPAARAAFRDACALSESDWLRAKAWALYGAVIALSYYRGGRNEALCRQSRRTLSRLRLLS